MKGKFIAGVVAAVVVVVAGLWIFGRDGGDSGSPYRLATIDRGDVEMTISSTGTLNPVTVVQVGTQVSGKIEELFVDFNDRVTKGQLIARIDPILQRQAVQEAEVSLTRAQADLARNEAEFARNKALFDQKVLTESEFATIEYNLKVSKASVASAELALSRARQNLSYTNIYAPIDGIVVQRDVEPGQTVAASMSAPQLFLIANDLAEMEILASVDESDIGRVKEGQTARFTVQAYPTETFEGTVRQVRLQSTTLENVVNYTAVIGVRNESGRLKPGMTASVEFMVETAQDVFRVPNAALRFRPTEEMLAKVEMPEGMRRPGGANGEGPDSAAIAARIAARRNAQGGQPTGPGGQGGAMALRGEGGVGGGAPNGVRMGRRNGEGASFAQLWVVDATGKFSIIPVRTGISDGTVTEISGPGLTEGMQVIAGLTQASPVPAANNPFQQGGPGGPGAFRGRGFGG